MLFDVHRVGIQWILVDGEGIVNISFCLSTCITQKQCLAYSYIYLVFCHMPSIAYQFIFSPVVGTA